MTTNSRRDFCRSFNGLLAAALMATLVNPGCTFPRSASAPAGQPVAAGQHVEAYRSNSPGQFVSAPLYLPGSTTRDLVSYQVVDGLAIMEGDMVLGRADTLLQRFGSPWLSSRDVKGAVVLSNRSMYWPNSEIPYEIDGSAQSQQANIQWTIDQLAPTSLKLRPRLPTDRDYVVFSNQDSGCWSFVGRIGGPQELQIEPACGRGATLHEVLHAAGFFHEQSRSDRDDHITIVWEEIQAGAERQFEKRSRDSRDVGAYDYGSIMHYSAQAFSRRGRPTIVPKVAGVRIGNREGLSALDRAAIEEVYGASTPNPPLPGLPLPPVPPTTPAPPTPPAPPEVAGGSFAGEYTSQQGPVSCSQNGASVQCRYPNGTLLCSANNNQLDCGWSGAGLGRAVFNRQANGVLAGTWGDAFSTTSRGSWDLVPAQGGTPAPPAPPAPPPPSAGTALGGNYTSSRGPMSCTESGTLLTCTFQEASGANGRLDCAKDESGLRLSCQWVTFLPQPGGGRAAFTRPNTSSRNLTGTWGHFHAESGGGQWTATGQ